MNLDYLTNLNERQEEAVLYLNGPLLIVAGAGSGKTRVLTARIAHIVKQHKAFPNQVLAVTFTNKAAKEMQLRVSKFLRKEATGLPWLGTFHSISAKILRKHAEAAGLKSNFSIIDQDDQVRLIKNICKSENIDTKKISPKYILAVIDKWKNKGFYPDEVILKRKDILEKSFLGIYKIYQQKLIDLNAADFSDLILHTVKIFERHRDISKMYSKKFKYILVDEYQDTNFIQSEWLKYLAEHNQNICCVGDDDQSIYSWRGAEIKNFLTFDTIYKNCKVFKLEQNYRSTKNILETASSLISNNSNRVGKKLWSSANQGELVKLNCYRTGREEAQGISDIIEHNLKKNYSLNNVSILVRAIYQTREFEERFLQVGIGYRVLGGIKFYERAEIKDAISYLRIINQKYDDLALERVIGSPKRGVGESTLNQIYQFGKNNNLCLEDSIIKILEKGDFKPKIKTALNQLMNMIAKWREDSLKMKHFDLLKLVLDDSGYSAMLKDKKDLENENRLENLKELLRAMQDYDNLQSFLEHVALATSIDQEWEGAKVNLMTMHGAKGLEFDAVFLPGWEEGLFPHQKSLEEKGDFALEEERRLAYVGITRAKKEAYLSFAMKRAYHGDWMDALPSRFINEIPEDSIEKNEVNIDKDVNDFEFNQDNSIEFDEEYRSPGWDRYKKNKMIKWKK